MNAKPTDLYLDLLKWTLTNSIYGDKESPPFDPEKREVGLDWPPYAVTMIGHKRLDNIQRCAKEVLRWNVPGDFVEAGVWRGGAAIFMTAILEVWGDERRKVWVCDSFKGLPPPNPLRYPVDTGDNHHTIPYLAVSRDEVVKNFARFSVPISRVRFVEGWFKDTLSKIDAGRFSLVRLDGDMYESTMDSLVALYPKLSPGGFIICDDFYSHKGPHAAVADYRRQRGIDDEIHKVDWSACYWRKS
jgi:O-methyltransferase